MKLASPVRKIYELAKKQAWRIADCHSHVDFIAANLDSPIRNSPFCRTRIAGLCGFPAKGCFGKIEPDNLPPQRMAASLIGCLGQALFPCLLWVIVAHPGHASLRSLFDAVMTPLHAYVGLAVESLAFRRASSGAAVILGFIYYLTGHVDMPEMARTSSGEGRPRQDWVVGVLDHAVSPTKS